MKECIACEKLVFIEDGAVDIGGLRFHPDCYQERLARTSIPCGVCGTPTAITSDPLITGYICSDCEAKADLGKAWADSSYGKGNRSCDKCGAADKWTHPDCWGQVVCADCYKQGKAGCIQCYPGDKGYPAWYPGWEERKPSVPAAALPVGCSMIQCFVCGSAVCDPASLLERFPKLASVCENCLGPKWWEAMGRFRDNQP